MGTKTHTFALDQDRFHFTMSRILLILLLLSGSSPLLAQFDTTHGKGRLTVVAEPGIERLQRAYEAKNESEFSMIGYRVQIYNGRKTETLKKRSEFLTRFPTMQPYTLYDAPEYKLQVGDFRTRLEAERFLKEVVREFGSGFVVKTEIQPPKLEYEMPVELR